MPASAATLYKRAMPATGHDVARMARSYADGAVPMCRWITLARYAPYGLRQL